MSEYHRNAMEFRIAARIVGESCESCERREFEFYIEDTFVCGTCAWWED